MCHALVASVGGFFGARVFLGVSEGGNFPSAIKAIALWFPKRERAFATAIFNSGTNVGAIIAPALVPLIALTWGWRAAFIFAGILGFLWLFLWFPFYDVPARKLKPSSPELAFIHSDKDEAADGGTPLGNWRALRYPPDLGLHRREVADRSGVVVLPDLAARLLQGDARARHQAQLDSPGDHLRHHHGAEHHGRMADRGTSRHGAGA